MDTYHRLVENLSTAFLIGNAIIVPTFVIHFAIKGKWRKTWAGFALLLSIASMAQLTIRALATARWGENYPGRDLVLLLGRAEIFVGIGVMYLGWLKVRRQFPDDH